MNRWKIIMGGLAMFVLASGDIAHAQGVQERSVEDILELFVEEKATPPLYQATVSSINIEKILWADPPQPAKADSVIDGLVAIVRGSFPEATKQDAISLIAFAGNAAAPYPRPRVADLLEELYFESKEWLPRTAALSNIWSLAENNRASALRFLERIVMTDPSTYVSQDEGKQAVIQMSLMGEQGRQLIRDLRARSDARDPQAKEWLRLMIERNFRIGPPDTVQGGRGG